MAAYVGQAMALLFGFGGLFANNPVLVFIALFVWIDASAEAGMVQVRSALGGQPVSRAMITDFAVLAPGDTLARAAELTLAGSQSDFPVLDAGRLVGILRQSHLLSGLGDAGRSAPVERFMCRGFETVDSHAMLDAAFARLEGTVCRTLPVTHADRLVGLLTLSPWVS